MKPFIDDSPLGQQTVYASYYDASLLFPIPRSESRNLLNVEGQVPFYGYDVWTGYELSWLNLKGKPEVAVAEFLIPANSANIIESKSFKLYLNSINQTKFSSFEEVKNVLAEDLSEAAKADVTINMHNLRESSLLVDCTYSSICIDDLDIEVDAYHPNAEYLIADDAIVVNENLCSHLLKSNCPVTGQPDWASVFIGYSGAKINRENLLRYVISFREHQDFHEHCVERIYSDILRQCKPHSLSVYARYTRRGGLDINPFRSTEKNAVPLVGRLLRQ